MIFKSRFQQGDIIASLIKNDNTERRVYRIFSDKGIYFVVEYNNVNDTYCIPAYGRVNFLNLKNVAGYTFRFVNNFVESDISLLAATSEFYLAFNRPTNEVAYVDYMPAVTFFDGLKGYIEPEQTDSPELQWLAIKATRYSLELSKLLQKNGISHPSFSEFSAI